MCVRHRFEANICEDQNRLCAVLWWITVFAIRKVLYVVRVAVDNDNGWTSRFDIVTVDWSSGQTMHFYDKSMRMEMEIFLISQSQHFRTKLTQSRSSVILLDSVRVCCASVKLINTQYQLQTNWFPIMPRSRCAVCARQLVSVAIEMSGDPSGRRSSSKWA